MVKRIISLALASSVFCSSAIAQATYDPALCAEVEGTLNINWVMLNQPTTCTGIEYTDGTQSMAQSGSVAMTGTGVSNPGCIGLGIYELTLSDDKLSLVGYDVKFNMPLTFTRAPGQACFTGTWGQADFLGYISAEFFPPPPVAPTVAPTAVPTLAGYSLFGLASLVAMMGFVTTRRKKT